ncbi:conjugal transfer protein TraG [Nocardioides phosphati]|uniref:Conjugal transfer protein TraG n=1 Tax=Nocardioides phosphati TaxID=1867775 RepID=A0ABQ2N5I4_9ACTN|nr:TraM recognition domain-containing protein [Nocardioides phosphati]GGO85308.1 conjugal transfer protein TraG [Nocardioides phosphati]
MKLRFDPWDVGWRIGDAHEPRGGELWVPWDRTAGVIGPQGSGKTLDLLTPALLGAPGAALVTLTKVEDLLLSLTERSRDDRPCVVLDPFGLAEGVVDELIWDPIAGCVDPKVAERRAKAFTAGTVKGAITGGTGDDAARFYAAESAKVLQGYFHAAALTGRTLEDVLQWVANPSAASQPMEILRRHPHAEPFWHGLLHGALNGDDRTAGNTVTTVQQAVSLFFQADIRRRCIPSPGRPATDLADVIRRRGTIYLLGREDPYASASPLMTAVAEHVLDTGLLLANSSPWGGRLCPPLVSVLDELPSTAPLPTLRTRMANERALGLSFIWAAQTRPQLTSIFGEHEARALLGLTNALVMFGGSKDVAFNQEISDLLGTVRIGRVTHSTGGASGGGRSFSGDDIPIMRPEEVRQLPERQALVVAENGKPIIAKLHRCVEGKAGERLLADQRALRERLTNDRRMVITPEARATAALVEARRLGFVDDETDHSRSEL